jgi:DNA-binding NarL/FixJ family response regulator
MPRLTVRETEIVRLVALALANKAIAAQLGTCEQTVKNQLTAIYRKLGIRTRTALAMWAYSNLATRRAAA